MIIWLAFGAWQNQTGCLTPCNWRKCFDGPACATKIWIAQGIGRLRRLQEQTFRGFALRCHSILRVVQPFSDTQSPCLHRPCPQIHFKGAHFHSFMVTTGFVDLFQFFPKWSIPSGCLHQSMHSDESRQRLFPQVVPVMNLHPYLIVYHVHERAIMDRLIP